MKVSIVISTINRKNLLELHFKSIIKQNFKLCDLEVVVINDGFYNDGTRELCDSYKQTLNIKYIFSGHRHKDSLIYKNPCLVNNIGIRNASGDIIILTCPEIYENNNCLELTVKPLLNNKKIISTPKLMRFDDTNGITENLLLDRNKNNINTRICSESIEMPFFMGIWKEEIINIGGYDEDFLDGYACEDNDFIHRLLKNGLKYYKNDCDIIHLYHGKRCDGKEHPENLLWVKNYSIFTTKKDIIVRNENKKWGFNSVNSNNIWHLKNIPKVLITYFGSEKMSYLRFLSLYSFKKYNPDWQIKLFTPKYLYKNPDTWQTHEQKGKYTNNLCYFKRLKELNIDIEEVDFTEFNLSNDMTEVHKSDFFRLIYLSKYGGVWADNDILYFKSINELIVNTELNSSADSIFCIKDFHSIGFLLSSPNNIAFKYLLDKSKQIFNSSRYETIGSELYTREFSTIQKIKDVCKLNNIINLPMNQLYYLDSSNIDKIYNNNNYHEAIYKEGIGCHWYAGANISSKWENLLTENNYLEFDNNLTQLIRKIYE